MCGIAGFSGNNISNDKLRILFVANETRGRHSCGIYGNANGGYTFKDTGTATSMVQKDEYDEVLSNSTIALLHTRFATTGAINATNSHPFQFGKYMGTHNGWVTNWKELVASNDLKRPDGKDIEVDSEVIYALMSKFESEGIDAFKKVIPSINMECALAFSYNNELYLYRKESSVGSTEKPLYYGIVNNNIYYSSLKEPLEIIRAKDIKLLTPNRLHKWDIASATLIDVFNEDVKTKEYVYTPSTTTTPSSSRNTWDDTWFSRDYPNGSSAYRDSLQKKSQQEENFQKEREKYLQYFKDGVNYNLAFDAKKKMLVGFLEEYTLTNQVPEKMEFYEMMQKVHSYAFFKYVCDEAYDKFIEDCLDRAEAADLEDSEGENLIKEAKVEIPDDDYYYGLLSSELERLNGLKKNLSAVFQKKYVSPVDASEIIGTVDEMIDEKQCDIEDYVNQNY